MFIAPWLAALASGVEVVDTTLPDRAFERLTVDLGGFVQPRFRNIDEDADANTTGEIGFSVQRVRLELESDLLPAPGTRWGFAIGQKYSIELMPEPRLQDAYVNLSVGTPLQLRVGQFKAPFHRAILASDANSLFPDRNQITEWFQDRQIGAQVHGWVGERVVEWQLGMFDGEGTNRLANVNDKFLYVGRIAISPWGSPGADYEILLDYSPKPGRFPPVVTLGASAFYNVEGPPGQEEGYTGYNLESFVHWRFVTAMAETFFKFTDYEPVEVADFHQLGWYVQLGAFLEGVPWARDHVALMGRVEQGDRLRPIDTNIPVTGPGDPNQASRRYSVGLGLYAGPPLFDAVQDLRAVVSYTVRQELEDYPFADNELNVSGNLTF